VEFLLFVFRIFKRQVASGNLVEWKNCGRSLRSRLATTQHGVPASTMRSLRSLLASGRVKDFVWLKQSLGLGIGVVITTRSGKEGKLVGRHAEGESTLFNLLRQGSLMIMAALWLHLTDVIVIVLG